MIEIKYCAAVSVQSGSNNSKILWASKATLYLFKNILRQFVIVTVIFHH